MTTNKYLNLMTKIINYSGILILYLLVSYSTTKADDNSFPSYKEMNKAVKFINITQELNNYLGDNFNIDETEKKIEYYKGKFTTNDRDECFVFLPCHDETAPYSVEFSNFGVLFYKVKNQDKWQFINEYIEIDTLYTLDFDKDGLYELVTEISWFGNGEFGTKHCVTSLKNSKFVDLFLRKSLDLDGQVMAPDDLNLEKQFLYEFDYKDINSDGKIDIIETYKVGKIIKFEGKSETPIYKYKTTIKNYLNINGKFVLDKKSKKKK